MIRIFSALLFCLALLSAQEQTKLVVFDLEPIGIEERVNCAIIKLVKMGFAENKKFSLIEPPADCQCYSPAPACSVAREFGADKAFIGSVLQIGEKYAISFQFINVADCQVEFSDKISTTVLEEMDVVTDRIVNAIVEKKPIEQTVEVGKVVEPEVPVFKTREPFAAFIMRVGYTAGVDTRMLTIESSLAYETKDIFTEALFGGRGREASEIYFDLLLHKISSTKDISTYFGGGLGLHYINNIQRSDDGLAVVLSGGLMGFRTYHFRLLLNARVSLTFTGEFGTVPAAGLTFGLTSPGLRSKGNDLGGVATCLGGCLGIYLITLLLSSMMVY